MYNHSEDKLSVSSKKNRNFKLNGTLIYYIRIFFIILRKASFNNNFNEYFLFKIGLRGNTVNLPVLNALQNEDQKQLNGQLYEVQNSTLRNDHLESKKLNELLTTIYSWSYSQAA